ncbi:MAG: translesion error-prone DNA polymerase V autoproteolytic subunit [Sediminibacterium sp.]|nr:translesion error-prone DNA polymerase V autoproteolytic subunit [Sediminibacterium sp.]
MKILAALRSTNFCSIKILIILAKVKSFYMEWEQGYQSKYRAADDYAERGIDLNELLIMNKPATYFFRMNSDAMTGSGIHAGDVLIVDRSLKPAANRIIVAAVDGELVVRRYQPGFNQCVLQADNRKYGDITINEFTQFQSWGVVTCVVHLLDPSLQQFLSPRSKK